MTTWRVHAFDLEALAADFPYARSLVVVRSERTIKKTGQTSVESRYYLSSRDAGEGTAAQWLGWIRGHWGGVEIRHYGLLANRDRPARIAQARALLAQSHTPPAPPREPLLIVRPVAAPPLVCPYCGHAALVLIRVIDRPHPPSRCDTS